MAARLSALRAGRTLPSGFFIFKDSWYSKNNNNKKAVQECNSNMNPRYHLSIQSHRRQKKTKEIISIKTETRSNKHTKKTLAS
jgi:hypothetical protein